MKFKEKLLLVKCKLHKNYTDNVFAGTAAKNYDHLKKLKFSQTKEKLISTLLLPQIYNLYLDKMTELKLAHFPQPPEYSSRQR